MAEGFEIGASFSHYRIVSKIGAGGMGEVYLAEDTRLNRKVALKLLSAEVAGDKERMRRFVQEAQAAAALNHPHVAHVYEIGQSEDNHFIAMEFVDGITLHDAIYREKTELRKLLKYLTQAAEGLSKAHAAGIVHRDLKPENIMISRDGFAKILDFGLAKLVESADPTPAEAEADTAILQQLSRPGVIMGTAGYMSPEQALGKTNEIDNRSDIFSFGCILFEAATRRRVFQGDSLIKSLHNIIYEPAPQIKDLNPSAPNAMQHIVRRCLAKDPEDRYQSIKEVAIELRDLRKEMTDHAEIDTSAPPISGVYQQSNGGESLPANTEMQAATTQMTMDGGRSRFGTRRLAIGACLVLLTLGVAAAGIFWGSRFLSGPSAKPGTSEPVKMTRLTNSGKVTRAVISPDGKFLSYVESEGKRQSLWTKQIATNSNVQVVAPAPTNYFDVTFTPDGNYVYFLARVANEKTASFYRVPTLGGIPVKVFNQVAEGISFSRDGSQIAFQRYEGSTTESSLIIANADGTNERKVAGVSGHEWFSTRGPAWSPDGKFIVSGAGDDREQRQMTMVAVNVSDQTIKPLTTQRWDSIGRSVWLSDGSGVLFSASENGTNAPRQIWHISYPNGVARRVTQDLNSYLDVSVTEDMTAIAAAQIDLTSSIWVSPNADVNKAVRIEGGRDDGAVGISWTPDGRIVYVSSASGNTEIWVMNKDGTERRQITSDGATKFSPVVSPDGRYIVFVSEATGAKLWRVDLDGGNSTQLTNGNYDSTPRISPDSQWVVYASYNSGKLTLWKVPITGGEPAQVTDLYSTAPDFSPDGKTIAAFHNDGQSAAKLLLLSIGSESSHNEIFLPQTLDWEAGPRWMPDGQSVTFLEKRGSISYVMAQPITGGSPKLLAEFKENGLLRREWSLNNKQVATVRGTARTDVVLIRNFK
ncbi:MAG: protein kinase domain-containing protein [Pyrinomonadaceae bacterium]